MSKGEFYDKERLLEKKECNFSTSYAVENGLIKPDDVIFDMGCGTGRDVNFLIQKGYDATGIDSNKFEDMIAIGKKMFGEDLPISEGDMTDTGLPDRSVDVFLCNTSLHFLKSEELERAFDEMERLARKGARIIGYEYSNESTNPDFRRYIDQLGSTPAETILEILDRREYKKLHLEKIRKKEGKVFIMFIYKVV